jgi:hypothetical protein
LDVGCLEVDAVVAPEDGVVEEGHMGGSNGEEVRLFITAERVIWSASKIFRNLCYFHGRGQLAASTFLVSY